MISGLPFDDLRNLISQLPGPDMAADATRSLIDGNGQGRAPLGRLADLAIWLSAWTGRPPRVLRSVVGLFAGTHGVSRQAAGRDVHELVERCAAGSGAVNQACVAEDLGLKVFDLALDVPTDDIREHAALDERAAAATIAFGMEATAGGADLLVLAGYGGQGGSVSAAALLCALHPSVDAAGPSEDVRAALACHADHLRDPLEAMRRLGGRETAALVGAIVAARMQKVAVVLDGEAALAAASVVAALDRDGIAHCLLADRGASAVAEAATSALGLRPLLDLGMSTQDGTAGVIAAGVVKVAALACSGSGQAVPRS